MVTFDLLLWFTALCSVPMITANPCPGVALLGSVYEITGTQQNISGIVWARPYGGQYVVTCNPSCSGTSPYSATYNTTYTTLHINRISLIDSGFWKLKDANDDTGTFTLVCNLTTANLPMCNISSDLDQHSLELGTTLSLTVDVRNYFCSLGAGFKLTAGNVTDTLLQNETVTNYANVTLNSILNVTLQRLGDVLLSFSCHSTTWDLPCTGVNQLLKSPPTCNITSDLETDELELGEEVTLSVDIKNYYCIENAGFNLTTGRVEEVLLGGHEVDNVASVILNKTFITTKDTFGKVFVKFFCDNYDQDLVCGGIQELVKELPTTTLATTPPSSKPSNTPSQAGKQTTPGLSPEGPGTHLSLIAGVFAGVLAFVIIVIVVLNRKKITAVARQYIVNRNAHARPYEQGLDNSTTDPTLDMTDNVACDDIKLDNVEKIDDSKDE
ncbi:uncharacterized protein [Haliotis asinina]|uniref:uncharacterized protein n=1 Tax=Haliotis asinina TaxID=109174 RepID=UPI0035320A51